jgi:two-component system CheB/CheR fusion protein
MPRSAIATGLVDCERPPAEMPAQLMAYATHAFGRGSRPAATDTPESEGALKKIIILLRAQTGHDFSQYKPSTIQRRIERRMAVHQIGALASYVRYLQQTPPEVEALFRDLLIGVTSFFRDAEAFKVLEEQIIPQLFADKPPGAVLRVWSPGCSTGEEAYSIAILLQEHMNAFKHGCTVQVFATDIDRRAIATARSGLYPASIAADVSPERLARFFTAAPEGSAYRIHKSIRDMLVFSEQDVIKDPPFSRIDLISCRNLLIYMGTELQKKLIPLFHYVLNPGGTLFLGTSESIGEFADLFAVLDRKAKLYRRKEDFSSRRRVPQSGFLPPQMAIDSSFQRGGAAGKTAFPAKLPLRELTEQTLLRQIAPASALVDAQGDILYLHGRTGMFLEPAPGESGINNILRMAREGLRQDLRIALHKAASTRATVRCPGLNVKSNGHFTRVKLTVCPVAVDPAAAPESPLFLVILQEVPADPEQAPQVGVPARAGALGPDFAAESIAESNAEARIAALQQELRAKDEYLQTTQEELETSNEELKSSNEELQSTNEELETSKEELQSVNEELATVNTELQTKVMDLSRTNNDMNNLLAGTGIGTVFVDHQLRILRFTPSASRIINLILSDVGRPVAHIVSNLVGYEGLATDTQAVLNTLIHKEIDVQTTEGKWYTMRIQPYRTLDNVIEGAVISFFDITETVQVRNSLRTANDLLPLAVVVRDARDAIIVHDPEGRILAWNPGAVRMYGWSETEALRMNVRDMIPQDLREQALATLRQLAGAEILEPCRSRRLTKYGAVVSVSMISTVLLNEAGEAYAIATMERASEASRDRRKGGGSP